MHSVFRWENKDSWSQGIRGCCTAEVLRVLKSEQEFSVRRCTRKHKGCKVTGIHHTAAKAFVENLFPRMLQGTHKK